ncbi:hypothetical protein TKK_0010042 [Trichogramma kaykai]|uniref:Protein ARV n=1 Tax=Trichogramma kaykai TaxID=54128 RepID=A0ABD2WYK9_9HYME
MYRCISCGAQVQELYRQYSPTVLKIVKCEECGEFADKYVEYDPVIVLVDMVLLDKAAYRHLLYNSNFKAYWKLVIILLLSESFIRWSNKRQQFEESGQLMSFRSERNFYFELNHTGLSLLSFVTSVVLLTELRWKILRSRPAKYRRLDLLKALVIGGCAKLLNLISIIWKQDDELEYQHLLIIGYSVLCLLTAYSVACDSGRVGSLAGLIAGLLAQDYVYNSIPDNYSATTNVTLGQSQGQ